MQPGANFHDSSSYTGEALREGWRRWAGGIRGKGSLRMVQVRTGCDRDPQALSPAEGWLQRRTAAEGRIAVVPTRHCRRLPVLNRHAPIVAFPTDHDDRLTGTQRLKWVCWRRVLMWCLRHHLPQWKDLHSCLQWSFQQLDDALAIYCNSTNRKALPKGVLYFAISPYIRYAVSIFDRLKSRSTVSDGYTSSACINSLICTVHQQDITNNTFVKKTKPQVWCNDSPQHHQSISPLSYRLIRSSQKLQVLTRILILPTLYKIYLQVFLLFFFVLLYYMLMSIFTPRFGIEMRHALKKEYNTVAVTIMQKFSSGSFCEFFPTFRAFTSRIKLKNTVIGFFDVPISELN